MPNQELRELRMLSLDIARKFLQDRRFKSAQEFVTEMTKAAEEIELIIDAYLASPAPKRKPKKSDEVMWKP